MVSKNYQLYYFVFQIALLPMVRLYRCANSDKYPEVSVVLSTASSFFVFFFLHGSVVLARHLMDASAIQMSTYHSWMIKVRHQKDVTLKELRNFHKLCVGREVFSCHVSMHYCTMSKSSKDTESKTLCSHFIEET